MRFHTTFHVLRAAFAASLLLCASVASSQNEADVINVPLSRPGQPISLDIDMISARIEIIGEERKDAQFAIKVVGGERKIKTPSGTKTLASGGGVHVREHDNSISVDTEFPVGRFEIVARIPRRADLDIAVVNESEIVVRDVTGSLQLENVNGPITATNIAGSIVAESVNQEIDVAFSALGKDGATSLTTLNGDIRLALPPDAKTELRIDNARGEIESDFELDVKPTKPTVERKEGRRGVSVRLENEIVAGINGGGPVIKLKTLNGTIRIAKTAK